MFSNGHGRIKHSRIYTSSPACAATRVEACLVFFWTCNLVFMTSVGKVSISATADPTVEPARRFRTSRVADRDFSLLLWSFGVLGCHCDVGGLAGEISGKNNARTAAFLELVKTFYFF